MNMTGTLIPDILDTPYAASLSIPVGGSEEVI